MTDLDNMFTNADPLGAVAPPATDPSAIDWHSAKVTAERNALAVDADLEIDIAKTTKQATKFLSSHVRGHQALNEALACVYAFAERNRYRPAKIIAALRNADMTVTRATISSPYLPFVRLLMPMAASALQSRYATGLAFLASEGCPADSDAAAEISRRGGIEACARAHGRAKTPATKNAESPISQLRAVTAPVRFDGQSPATMVPREPCLGVLIVERRDDGLVVAHAYVRDASVVESAARLALKNTTRRHQAGLRD